jgi:hypothetical protein
MAVRNILHSACTSAKGCPPLRQLPVVLLLLPLLLLLLLLSLSNVPAG